MRKVLHVDLNSYFATIEQQANPRLRGKPIGVTGGDRLMRTVLGAASIEAKKLGVKTGMQVWQAKKICPKIIIVKGDSDKYLSTTKKFLNILKDYTPYLEIFSIDESFMELKHNLASLDHLIPMAWEIKSRIRQEIGEWVSCSIGISYNKLLAKLASSLQKPDGLVVISNQYQAKDVLDRIELDDICGIGSRIKKRLQNLGITNFKTLRSVPKDCLLASFKSYGEILYQMARGVDNTEILPFYLKEEVKSIGHRHTISHDTADLEEIKQVLLKISEMVAIRLRDKKLVSKTIHCYYRSAFKNIGLRISFEGGGKQLSLPNASDDGLKIFQAALSIFNEVWDKDKIRMIGVTASQLKPSLPQNLSLLPEDNRQKTIVKVQDVINKRFGDFTLTRAAFLKGERMRRKPNPYLSDRRFKI